MQALLQQPAARVIGAWAIEINSAGKSLRARSMGPGTVEEFRALHASGLRVPLIHPSVLMHRPTILALGGYDPAFGASADTELWTRVAHRHAIVIVPVPLILYRIHSQSMSFRRLFRAARDAALHHPAGSGAAGREACDTTRQVAEATRAVPGI